MAFGRLQTGQRQDLPGTLRAILKAGDGERRAHACAQLAATLELVLRTPEAPVPSVPPGRAELRVENVDLNAPLTQKHWKAAMREFMELKEAFFAPQALASVLVDAAFVQGAREVPQR